MNLLRVVAVIAIASGAAACTIEHTKPLNADCLQDRECVEPLECQSRSDGRYACTMPGGRLPPDDAAIPNDTASDAAGDAVTDGAADGSADTSVAPDVSTVDSGSATDVPVADGGPIDASSG